jgi:hypothetical protein
MFLAAIINRERKASPDKIITHFGDVYYKIEKLNLKEYPIVTVTLIKKYVSITELDRATAVEPIDHITVSASAVKPREIVVYCNFIGKVEKHSLRLTQGDGSFVSFLLRF